MEGKSDSWSCTTARSSETSGATSAKSATLLCASLMGARRVEMVANLIRASHLAGWRLWARGGTTAPTLVGPMSPTCLARRQAGFQRLPDGGALLPQ